MFERLTIPTLATRPSNASPSVPATSGRPSISETALSLAPSDISIPANATASLSAGEQAAITRFAAEIADGMSLVFALQARLRDLGTDLREQNVTGESHVAESAEAERAAQIEQAIERAMDAIDGMPKWVQKLVGGIVTAVGAVASIFGGAGAGLVVAGVALLVAAEVLTQLVDHGVIKDGIVARVVIAAVQIVGAVLLACAGGDGIGQAADSVQKAIKIAKDVVTAVQNILQTIHLGIDIHNAVCEYDASMHQLNAALAEQVRDEAHANMESEVEALTALQRSFTRVAARLREAENTRNEGLYALASMGV